MVDEVAVRAELANEEAEFLQGRRSVVDGGRFDIGFSEGEPQFGQVRHLLHLSAGGLEQDCRAHPAMDVLESAIGVRVQGHGVRSLSGDVGVDGGVETLLAQLSQHDGPEFGDMQRRGA